METQLLLLDEDKGELDPSKFVYVKNSPRKIYKPYGGLWTSTYLLEEDSSAWQNWAQSEMPHWRENEVRWLLEPKKDARIFTIDSEKDLHIFYADYGMNIIQILFSYFPPITTTYCPEFDFEEASWKYDRDSFNRKRK